MEGPGDAVVSNPDLLEQVTRRVAWMDAGSLLLTCWACHNALQASTQLPCNPSSTEVLVAYGEAPVPLHSLEGRGIKVTYDKRNTLESVSTARMWGGVVCDDGLLLSQLKNLVCLDLWERRMGPMGAERLASALSRLTALTSLDLYDNRLGARGMQALAPSLGVLEALEWLDLGCNGEVGAVGALHLTQALQSLKELTWLRLRANCIGTQGGRTLAETLGELPRLQYLDMARNKLLEDGALAVTQSLRGLCALTAVDLMANAIGEQAFVKLRADLPSVRVDR